VVSSRDDEHRDAEALRLRSTGQSFAAIEHTLGFERPAEAFEAFVRALKRCPPAQQATERDAELERLSKLAADITKRARPGDPNAARQLEVVHRLRQLLLEG